MGQCMSRKAAGAFAASAAVAQSRPTKMHKQQLQSPDDDDPPPAKPRPQPRPPDSNRRPPTRGVATSFGFKRRGAAPDANAARRLASPTDAPRRAADPPDANGNDAVDTDSLTGHAAPSGRSTPKLAPPRKEAVAATRGARFGFRNAQGTRQNKVADLNCPVDVYQNRNINIIKKPIMISRTVVPTDNNNPRSGMMNTDPPPQINKFTLQSTHLPRPEPIRLIETKTAKTLANNNRRVAGMYHHSQKQPSPEDNSSKDGSLTEDSGLGSHLSGHLGEVEILRGMDRSPTFGARRRKPGAHKPRSLEAVVTGKQTFDLRDSNESCDSAGAPPLPRLPSAFRSAPSSGAAGSVRERALEYQRTVSKTSSEGFSDDEEKTYRDKFKSEKTFLKPAAPRAAFLKSRAGRLKDDSSPPSSDEHEWGHGGEAMADDVSFSFSSSDESRDRHRDEPAPVPASAAVIGTVMQSLMGGSMSKATFVGEVRNVMLNIEDPKFAAVAAANKAMSLLDDETLLSPSDSVTSFSESGDKKKLHRSSSNSKEINEKQSSSSPGTPTNASNSLSLSDGKDDFLIDDEIADQPSLVFEDAPTLPNENSTDTMIGSTPKSKRKVPSAFFGSPISARSKKFSQNRTGSLDTLSPCESIASDDLMMDFCVSQGSGLEEGDGQSSGYPSLNDTIVKKSDTSDSSRTFKDWDVIVGSRLNSEKHRKGTPTRTRLLSSRTSTPNTTPLDSPRSLDSRPARAAQRPCATPRSPARLARFKDLGSGGYDSDDSVRLDKASHAAVKQDLVGIKTMLLKLRRVLNESDTYTPFDSHHHHHHLANGIFRGAPAADDDDDLSAEDNAAQARLELADLGRQVLFLQGQLEDRERTVRRLRETAGGRERSPERAAADERLCNAATQTERIRPISAGPSLLNGSPVDGSAGSLVSATEPPQPPPPNRRCRPPSQAEAAKQPPSRLWRQPGEPPSPQRYAPPSQSSIPRRAHSRTRAAPAAAS